MADNIKYRFIQNVGDYFPSGYFSEDFIDKVQKASGLTADGMAALCQPYAQLRREYEAYKNYSVNTNPRVKDAIRHTHDFNSRLLRILGYGPMDQYCFYGLDEASQAVVPVRQVLRRGAGVSMLIMEMQHLIPVGDRQPSGLFEQRYNQDGDEQTARRQQYYAGQWSEVFALPNDARISPAVISKAIDALFLLPPERRPHYILMMAGNALFLLDAEKWGRGAYLQFSLDELFSQAGIAAFRKYYALFHLLVCKETLAADSDTVLMDKLVEESYKSAYEVTRDLKDGVVMAVETLANEALDWWRRNDSIPVTDYTDDTFEAEVKDDCLTIVYRLLFIFYAESREELNILPTADEVYARGYSLEMLRDLEKVPLASEEARNGFFIHESLSRLFGLLSSGYRENGPAAAGKSFSVRHIDSPLFNDARLKHLAGVKMRNLAWQKIIRALSLSHRDRQVGRISYANLGVNQLGSVYESLLAYRGFYAEEDYIEVHQAGSKATDDTFLVPYSRMDDFEPDEILRGEDGAPAILRQGTFVYRLNGRDRQKSASYYTPEALTRSTVKYALKTIVDEVAQGRRKATELLDLKILEPAMGAAAFQNEVINQLAEAYLTYQQKQRREAGRADWRVAPDAYRDELQKVKAYIATHNVYGVDLNPTAIELGKLSLWLNVIHRDMETPFFSNRLALGNAVVGAWLKVYSKEDFYGQKGPGGKLTANAWWERAPHKVAFGKAAVRRSVNEVWHFLLPDKNMLGARAISELKRANPEVARGMGDLIKDWTAPIGDKDFRTLQRLSAKVDALLKEYFKFQLGLENVTRNKSQIWGVPGEVDLDFRNHAGNYAEKEHLNDTRYMHNNAYFRLKMVMDYWCALWFWTFDDAAALPRRDDYWNDIEAMLRVSDDALDARTAKALRDHRENEAADGGEEADADKTSQIIRLSKEEILLRAKGEGRGFFDDSERFKIVKRYADRHHFFHPMLEFLEVFWLRGGFDVVCGNPPWIKLEFDEAGVISDKYPEVAIRKVSAPEVRRRVGDFLANPALRALYTAEQYENAGTAAFLGAPANYPLLIGQKANLYKCVLTNCMDLASEERGYIGLLTPEGIYSDPKGQPLRRELYRRLRYHFQYQNELRLFAEVHHHTVYGDQLLGPRSSSPNFLSIHNLFHPATVDACFAHDGHGLCGGIKDQDGRWNTAAHRDRIVHFGQEEIALLSDTFEDGTTRDCAKLVSIHSREIIEVLGKIQNYPTHVRDNWPIITVAIDQTGGVDKGIMERRQDFVPNVDDYEMICSGPHFHVANPCFKTPRRVCALNSDYDNISLTEIEADFVPRANYAPVMPREDYCKFFRGFQRGQDESGKPMFDNWLDYYKVGFRRMLSQAGERSLICAVLQSKTAHINTVISAAFRRGDDCVDMAALCSSLPLDFYIKTVGASDLFQSRMASFPLGVPPRYQPALYSRALLLNCLTEGYADLWRSCWRPEYAREEWSVSDARLKPFGGLTAEWEWHTPLRNHFERRQALVETDVLAAMALGLSLKDLELIFTIQFPVLQQNEADTWYDSRGDIVFTCSKGLTGVGCERKEWEAARGAALAGGMAYAGAAPTHTHTVDPKKSELYGGREVTYAAPYDRRDRLADYRRAWAFFEERIK